MTGSEGRVTGTDSDTLSDHRTEFAGYRRDRDAVGARNRVLVLPSVICSHSVADRIADAVDGAWSAPHDHGCAHIGADRDQTRRTLIGVGANPNVAGAVVVGLGCETVQSDDVAEALRERGVSVERTTIQDAGGTEACYEEGVAAARRLVEGGAGDRTTVPLSEATIGVVASDLRSSSLEMADPLVGEVVESVADAGGRVLVAAADRITPHAEAHRDRLATAEARAGFDAMVERARTEPARATAARDRAATAEPDEVRRLWGDRPIQDVLGYAERPTHDSGVALVDAPSSFAEAATGLVAAGAQLIVHVTADGIPSGHPVAPVLKVTGDTDTYAALGEDLDVDARVATPDEVVELLNDALSGSSTASETHGVTSFGMTRAGPSM